MPSDLVHFVSKSQYIFYHLPVFPVYSIIYRLPCTCLCCHFLIFIFTLTRYYWSTFYLSPLLFSLSSFLSLLCFLFPSLFPFLYLYLSSFRIGGRVPRRHVLLELKMRFPQSPLLLTRAVEGRMLSHNRFSGTTTLDTIQILRLFYSLFECYFSRFTLPCLFRSQLDVTWLSF